MTSQLEKTRAEVEKEKTRNLLLRSVSHDIRSPLTGIAGSSGFLAANYDSISKEDAVSLLQDMEKDARALTRMVENLLNMTRIQDGRLTIKKRKEILDDLISDAVSRVIKKDNTRRVILDSGSQMLLVPVDGRLMTQVFVNLLDNAIQYTPEYTVITVRTVLSDNGSNAIITVADNGSGIDIALIGHIFENFVTGSTYTDSRHGLGLGLPICRTIVEAHGGTITAENALSGGAIFTITLPIKGKHNE